MKVAVHVRLKSSICQCGLNLIMSGTWESRLLSAEKRQAIISRNSCTKLSSRNKDYRMIMLTLFQVRLLWRSLALWVWWVARVCVVYGEGWVLQLRERPWWPGSNCRPTKPPKRSSKGATFSFTTAPPTTWCQASWPACALVSSLAPVMWSVRGKRISLNVQFRILLSIHVGHLTSSNKCGRIYTTP